VVHRGGELKEGGAAEPEDGEREAATRTNLERRVWWCPGRAKRRTRA
jgi:hypothetical protein